MSAVESPKYIYTLVYARLSAKPDTIVCSTPLNLQHYRRRLSSYIEYTWERHFYHGTVILNQYLSSSQSITSLFLDHQDLHITVHIGYPKFLLTYTHNNFLGWRWLFWLWRWIKNNVGSSCLKGENWSECVDQKIEL